MQRGMYQIGEMAETLGLADESGPGAGWRPLLVEVMRDGRRTDEGRRTLEEAHDHFEREWQSMPDGLKDLRHPDPHPVEPTSRLRQITARVDVDLEAAGVAVPRRS